MEDDVELYSMMYDAGGGGGTAGDGCVPSQQKRRVPCCLVELLDPELVQGHVVC